MMGTRSPSPGPSIPVRLRVCRQLLRDIQCEAVVIDSDQNLYDILITSEDKKIVLLTWLLQNLFGAQCVDSKFEDLMSVFMDCAELKSFLNCTMLVESQIDKWLLILDSVKQIKEQPVDKPRDIVNDIDRKLLDEYIELWDRKVVKPSASLHPQVRNTSTNISDIQNDIGATEERLKHLTLSSGSDTEKLAQPSVPGEIPEDVMSMFVELYLKIKDEFGGLFRPSTVENSSGLNDSSVINDVQRKLKSISQDLSTLQEIFTNYFDPLKNQTK